MKPDSTRWTMIKGAAAGQAEARDEFARRYAPVIRAYLTARWRKSALHAQVDDAAQQVFVECFRDGGPLQRADAARESGFRGYLFGIVHNVARRFERDRRVGGAPRTGAVDLDEVPSDEESLSRVFDRAWAQAVLRDAAARHFQDAKAKGPDALRRHRLLAMRYGENLPIREIAKQWDVDAGLLHGQFRQAREEFRRALTAVVRERSGADAAAVEAECQALLEHFS